MNRWFFSLQFRLIVGFALVLALALGSVGLYIGYAARREVERIQLVTDEVRNARIEQLVSQFYATRGEWAGLHAVVEMAGSLYGKHIVVADANGQTVGDSLRRADHPWRRGSRDLRFSPVRRTGLNVGSFLVAPADAPQTPQEPPLSQFAVAINRSLVWAGLVAGAGGIILVALMSGGALRPLRALNTAARRLGHGDLSQRVPTRGRDEVGVFALTFNSMAEGLEVAERQRENLVADVAHELRTPLSNIRGYIEAILDGVLEPDRATIDTIHEQVLLLGRLVEDLRLLALTEAGDLRLDLEPDSLDEVVRRSAEGFRPRADAGGVAIHIDLPAAMPLVDIDRMRIAQVMGNLLENAVRHTPSGGEVSVSATADDQVATVAVADTGEGIPAEELPYVFERFYRTDPSRARATGGAGLGLTIARRLVELHGGSIRAESGPGRGSRFIFELPVSRRDTTTFNERG